MKYEELLDSLRAQSDEKFRVFNERIVNVEPGKSIGVRIPLLRAEAKRLVKREDFSLEELFCFPDEYFEVRVLKCLCAAYARMTFAQRVGTIRRCLAFVDGWAVCDVFCSALNEVEKHRGEYLEEIRGFILQGTEFSQRFGYVMLLGHYMQEEYLGEIFALLDKADTEHYYTMMGAAWLLAEVLVKFYERGVAYLKEGGLAANAKRKAIQKACESYRIDGEQKIYLKSLKN